MNKFLALWLMLLSLNSSATEFVMQSGDLRFFGEQQGERFEGRFKSFSPVIVLDDATPERSKLEVQIDLASVDSANGERDSTLQSADFFDVIRFPKAVFVTQAVRRLGDGGYEADASLTIRNKTVALKFPFTLSASEAGLQRLRATVQLDRMAFDVGVGDWADASFIGHAVEVHVDLQLKPVPAQ